MKAKKMLPIKLMKTTWKILNKKIYPIDLTKRLINFPVLCSTCHSGRKISIRHYSMDSKYKFVVTCEACGRRSDMNESRKISIKNWNNHNDYLPELWKKD